MPVSHGVAAARGRVAGLTRSLRNNERADEAALTAAKQELDVAKLSDHVQRVVDAWPDLTDEQLDRVACILRGGGTR
jgi:hypothetical protein